MGLAQPPALSEQPFLGWPAWRLAWGPLVLHLVPAVGGRLMGMAWGGHELAFVHPALAGRQADLTRPLADQGLCVDWPFPLWGGGKTWLAPQADWPGACPHPDLDSGAWQVTEAGQSADALRLALRSPVCRFTGLQLERQLCLDLRSDPLAPQWRVTHLVHNLGPQTRQVGLWDVLMLRRPATVPLPAQQGAPAVQPTPGQPSLADLQDAGVLQGQGLAPRLRCAQALEFKLGLQDLTVAADLAHPAGPLRYRRRSEADANGPWAHGAPTEIFNAAVQAYFELESHSPLWTLAPGARASWCVHEQLQASSPA